MYYDTDIIILFWGCVSVAVAGFVWAIVTLRAVNPSVQRRKTLRSLRRGRMAIQRKERKERKERDRLAEKHSRTPRQYVDGRPQAQFRSRRW